MRIEHNSSMGWITADQAGNQKEAEKPLLDEMLNPCLKIRRRLLESLDVIEGFESCTLLDYPLFFNIGDHLIWLSLVRWVQEVRKADVLYVSSPGTFSHKEFERKSGKGPILFTGGGNLGDIWEDHQKFREEIISKYHDRPIVLMPQSIYFKSPAKLEQARRVFNGHPNLTLFVREDVSHHLAKKYFNDCRVVLSPDIAFYLADRIHPSKKFETDLIFLQRRHDREVSFERRKIRNPRLDRVVFGDWVTMTKGSQRFQKVLRRFPSLEWLWNSPDTPQLLNGVPAGMKEDAANFIREFSGISRPSFHLKSLYMVMQGIRQMMPFRLVISNRLHGHILCTLMGKANVLLSNSYHKNEAYYRTWTSDVPYTAFASRLSFKDLTRCLESDEVLLSIFSNNQKSERQNVRGASYA